MTFSNPWDKFFFNDYICYRVYKFKVIIFITIA